MPKIYDDYPQSATNNAKRALKWLKENDNPNNCLTPVGFSTARKLANREKLDKKQRRPIYRRLRRYCLGLLGWYKWYKLGRKKNKRN